MPCRESHSVSVAFDPASLPRLLESLGGKWTLFPLGELKVMPLAGSLLGTPGGRRAKGLWGAGCEEALGRLGPSSENMTDFPGPLGPAAPRGVGAAPFTQRLEASRTLNLLARQCLLLGASAWPHVTVRRPKHRGCRWEWRFKGDGTSSPEEALMEGVGPEARP